MNCTVTFSCDDLSVTTMDLILLSLKHGLVGKTWARDKNDSFKLVFKYKGIKLTKGLKDRIEKNGVINIE
jgi:hypothetical protein